MTTEFELTIIAFAFFDTLMLILMLKALTHIRVFNRALHNILLDKQINEEIKTHLHIRIQSPIKVWKETEQPQKSKVMAEAPKKNIKTPLKADQTKPEAPKKEKTPEIPKKAVTECLLNEHKWVMDNEKNYYCSLCGKRF